MHFLDPAAVPRPPSPEPEPDTGLLSLVRRVWPVWGVEESKLSTVIEFVRFELEICFPGVVGSIVRFGITSALYFSGYARQRFLPPFSALIANAHITQNTEASTTPRCAHRHTIAPAHLTLDSTTRDTSSHRLLIVTHS